MSLTYLWNFGDGTTSTEENPVHIYAKIGKYTVTLTVTDTDLGTVVESKTNYITVTRKDLDKFKTTKSFTLGIYGEVYGDNRVQAG